MPRRRIFLTKLAVGGALVAGAVAAMILAHGVHTMTPGRHAFPFYWSMTVPSWHMWLILPALYSAAFLTGVRPGRWVGSKLFPLVAGGAIAFVLAAQPWWWIALVGAAVATAVCIACTLQAADTRDY